MRSLARRILSLRQLSCLFVMVVLLLNIGCIAYAQNQSVASSTRNSDERERTLKALYAVKPASSERQVAELLYQFNSSGKSAADCQSFFERLAQIDGGELGKGMKLLIKAKTKIEDAAIANKGLSRSFLGDKLAGGGSTVERALLSYRKQVTLDAIAQVAREFAGKGGGYDVFLAEIGKWASQNPDNFTFAGDIDFSFVSLNENLAWRMKQRFDQIIEKLTGLTTTEFDSVCTAHRKATPDVYILKHGEIYGDQSMQSGKLKQIDLSSGTVSAEGVPADAIIEGIARKLAATRAEHGQIAVPQQKTEPGLSMEMVRHLNHDIVKPGIFDPIDSIIKASKYVDRSVASSKRNKDSELAVFAREITKCAKNSDFATMARLIKEKFPDLKIEIDCKGTKPTARLQMSKADIASFAQQCSDFMWKNAELGIRDSINALKSKLANASEADLLKLRAEAKELREILETQIMVTEADHVEVPEAIKALSEQLKTLTDNWTAKKKLRAITTEEMHQKKWIEECIKARTPSMTALAVERICSFAGGTIEFFNDKLDILDSTLLGELRGESSELDDLIKQAWEMKKAMGQGTKPSQSALSSFRAKAANAIKSSNTAMNMALSSTSFGRGGLKVMQGVNLLNEGEAYYQAYKTQGWEGVSTEFFKRRVPGGAVVDAYYEEKYLRMGIEVVYTVFPPLAIPEGLAGMVEQGYDWSAAKLHSWHYKATVDELYDGCTFEKVGTGKGWRLVSLKYRGLHMNRQEAFDLPQKCSSIWRLFSPEVKIHPVIAAYEDILKKPSMSDGPKGDWPYQYAGLTKYGNKVHDAYLQEVDRVVKEYFKGVIEELERRKGLSTGTAYADISKIEKELGCNCSLATWSGDSAADVKLYDKIVTPYRLIKQSNATIEALAQSWSADFLQAIKPECSIESIEKTSQLLDKRVKDLKAALDKALADVREIVGDQEASNKSILHGPTRARLGMAWFKDQPAKYARWYEEYQEELDKLRKSKFNSPVCVTLSITEPVAVGEPAAIMASYDRTSSTRTVEWKFVGTVLEQFSSTSVSRATWTPAHPGNLQIVLRVKDGPKSDWVESRALSVKVFPRGEGNAALKVRLRTPAVELFQSEILPVSVEVLKGNENDPFTQFFWSENGVKQSASNASTYWFKGNGKRGPHTLSLTARTAQGRLAQAPAITITVLPGAQGGLRVWILPSDKNKLNENERIVLEASVVRKFLTGGITFSWYVNGKVVSRTDKCTVDAALLPGKTVQIGLKVAEVVNGLPLRSGEAQKIIEIVRKENTADLKKTQAPALKLSLEADKTILEPGRIAAINCQVSGLVANDRVTSYSWAGCPQPGGKGNLASFHAQSVGKTTISCRVTTASGASAESSMVITVRESNVRLQGLPGRVFYGQTIKVNLQGLPPQEDTTATSASKSGEGWLGSSLRMVKNSQQQRVGIESSVDSRHQISSTSAAPPGLMGAGIDVNKSQPVPVLKSSGNAQRTFIWHSTPSVKFAATQTTEPGNQITFTRMGNVKVWAEIVNMQGSAKQIAESSQMQTEVVSPTFSIGFQPASGKLGQEVRANIREQPPVKDELIDFRWMNPDGKDRTQYTTNGRVIGFVAKDLQPLKLSVMARVPVEGDVIADPVTATYTGAQAYAVKLEVLPSGIQAREWQNGKGLVTQSKTSFFTDEQIRLRASITGGAAPANLKWSWFVNEGTSISSLSANDPAISRHQSGDATATATALVNGVQVGKATISCAVREQEAPPKPAVAKPAVSPPVVPRALAPQGPPVPDSARKAEELSRQAEQAREAGNLDKAIGLYDRAVELAPQDGNRYFGRGRCKQESGDQHGALADFSKAIKYRPNFGPNYSYRALVLGKLGRLEDAIADYGESIRLNPSNLNSYHNRAIMEKKLNRFDDAISDYTRGISHASDPDAGEFLTKPKNRVVAEMLTNRGYIKQNQGKAEEALRDYQEALRWDPQVPYVRDLISKVAPQVVAQTQPPVPSVPARSPVASGTVPSRSTTIGNDFAVENGPSVQTTFEVARRSKLTYLMTYHWNYGNGKTPGQIGVQSSSRRLSWQATGSPTSGRNINVYWEVRPDAILEPGVYTVLDSDPSTWSCNNQSGRRGHAVIKLSEVSGGEGLNVAPILDRNVRRLHEGMEQTYSKLDLAAKATQAYSLGQNQENLRRYDSALEYYIQADRYYSDEQTRAAVARMRSMLGR